MALITNANEKSVMHAIAKVNIFDSLNLDIYKHPIQMLSDPEKKHLIKIREVFKNFDLYIDRIYKNKITIDTKSFVYEGSKSAYHYYNNCDALNSDYIDYSIPVEVKEKGDKEIEKYRSWFKDNESLLDTDPKLFSTRLQAVFFIKNPKSIERIAKKNSGHTVFDNTNLTKIESEIDSLLKDADNYRNSSTQIAEIIEKFGYLTHKSYSDPIVSTTLSEWHTRKSILKDKLVTYYRVKFNPNIEFQGELLSALGFVECTLCSHRRDEEGH